MQDYPITSIQGAVLDWYKKHGRHTLPWRNLMQLGVDEGYGVLVSEIMLQQTQVERVLLKFKAFVHMFPTVQTLAEARQARVVVLWSGLGYNRRAILLQKAAQQISRSYAGKVPEDPDELASLPGIGPYTAAAVAAFAYNREVAVLDTNIERFFELLFWGYAKPSPKEMRLLALRFVPKGQSRTWHSALMDLMSQVRKLKSPLEQQEELVRLLKVSPTWSLPKLSAAPLKRPKQSKFLHSPRFYRGRIIAYLSDKPTHRTTFVTLQKQMIKESMPETYSLPAILGQLRQDELIVYRDPLRPRTIIRLP